MSPQFSVYLNLVRVLCALVIFLSHLGHGHLVGGYLWPFPHLGSEARGGIFVLSGFLIAYVTDRKEPTAADYAAARLARLYSVILPAMLLTLTLDAAGLSIHPGSYEQSHAMSEGDPVLAYLLSLFMLNQSWDMDMYFGSNGTYWVMPYEFWYYVMFGSFLLLRGLQRIVFCLGGALVAGPGILVIMPIWLMGVASYHMAKRLPPGRLGVVAAIGGLAMLGAMVGTEVSNLGDQTVLGMTVHGRPWRYLVGACMALHLYGASQCVKRYTRFFALIERPVSRFSDCAMSLMLFHLPIVSFLHAVELSVGESPFSTTALIVVPIWVALTFGHWCERQKKPFNVLFRRMILVLSAQRFMSRSGSRSG
jgi:hypothetical protein